MVSTYDIAHDVAEVYTDCISCEQMRYIRDVVRHDVYLRRREDKVLCGEQHALTLTWVLKDE